MTMPFGKHRGRAIADVPSEYLEWLSDQEWPDTWMKRCIAEELNLRKEISRLRRLGPQSGGLSIKPAEVQLVKSMLDIGYRAVKLRSHPGTIKRLDHVTAKLRTQLDAMEGNA